MLKQILLTASLAFFPFAAHSQNDLDDETKLVLKSVQKRYQKIKNWKAKFTQDSFSVGLGKASNNNGAFYFIYPDKFRFSLLGPEHSDFVSNGKQAWYATYKKGPKEKADVIEFDDIKKLNLNRYLILFRGLQGAGESVDEILKEFHLEGKYKSQNLTLILTPKNSTEISQLTLYFSNESEVLKKAEIVDLVGNRNTLIINTHEPIQKEDPKVFQKKYPKGSRVKKGAS